MTFSNRFFLFYLPGLWILTYGCLLPLVAPAAHAVIATYTLPLPFRTSVEYVNAPPAVYSTFDPDYMAYPIDINGDGANEFVIEHYNASGGRARLYSTKTANQVVTDTREEEVFGVQVNAYALPLPPGVLVGADIAGTNIKWGNQCPCPEADILGLGPVSGFYGLGIELGGLDGWYSIRFNRLLPADWDYLPFRIQLDDGLHYGYMRLAHERALNGNSARVYAVLRGWAWETEPGVPITIVPEPQTATAVMLVGAVAAGRRRRRSEQASAPAEAIFRAPSVFSTSFIL
jgi:hypothetical protein